MDNADELRAKARDKRDEASEQRRLADTLDDEAAALERRAETAQMAENAKVPVNRDAVQLTDGSPVPEDRSHTAQRPDGQQAGYIVLSPEERAKGFVRPYRDAYKHSVCGKITTMARSIAETYARDPYFYSGTFCTTCRGHFPVGPDDGEFTWYEMDGREGPKVGT